MDPNLRSPPEHLRSTQVFVKALAAQSVLIVCPFFFIMALSAFIGLMSWSFSFVSFVTTFKDFHNWYFSSGANWRVAGIFCYV